MYLVPIIPLRLVEKCISGEFQPGESLWCASEIASSEGLASGYKHTFITAKTDISFKEIETVLRMKSASVFIISPHAQLQLPPLPLWVSHLRATEALGSFVL